jgi:hypothetical protein
MNMLTNSRTLAALFGVALAAACGSDSKESSPGPVVPDTDAQVQTGGSGGGGAGGQAAGGGGGQAGGAGGEAAGGGGGQTGGAGGTGGQTGGAQAGGSGGDTGDAGVTTDGGVSPDAFDPAQCVGDNGCWSCAPQEQTHFLNRCTSSDCAPFDNAARLPLYADPLPALP